MNDIQMYILLIFLILLSAFFSASETALSTANRIKLENSAKEGNKKAKKALFMINNFDRALTTILIGNNVVNIAASSIATLVAIKAFGETGTAIATGIMTLVILTFGEILPKCIAREFSESFSLAIASVMRFLMCITYPLVFLFLKLKKLVYSIIPKKNKEKTPSLTEQELKYIIENIEDEGVLEKQESLMVQRSLEFDEKTVQEILTPRVDMTTIDLEDGIDKSTATILEERYSRIPVCVGSCDKIVGILHTRDFLEAMLNGEVPEIENMMNPPTFVFKTKKLSSLLNDFKRNKTHLTIVTDDYGGTLGLVTMEDLLEELVGDIWDEDEEIEHDYIKLSENKYEISGDMSVRDLFDLFEINYKSDNFYHNTVGGWALEILSHIPIVGEVFEEEGLKVTIKQVSEHRVIKMIIEKIQTEELDD